MSERRGPVKIGKGRWKGEIHCRGHRLTRIFGSKAEAVAWEARTRAEIYRDPSVFGRKKVEIRLEDHARDFLELYSKQNKRSWRRDKISLAHLTEFFSGKYLSEITPEGIERYRMQRKAEGAAPGTINRELACLKTLFNKAIEWEKAERNPAAKIKKFREPNSTERILTIDEAKRLLAAASPDLQPVLMIALNTGMRRGEILALRWRDADFVKGFILIEDSKSGKARKIPMSGPVFDLLRDRKQGQQEDGFIFPGPGPEGHVMDIKTAFGGACRRAGIQGLRFHDLRHTAASRMIDGGADLVTVSKILGHASIQMTMRYVHPTEQNMRAAVGKLGQYFEKQGENRETITIRPLPTQTKSIN